MNIFDPKNNLEWRDYLKILKRRIWYFIVPFLIVMPIGIYKIVSHVPLYQARSYVQILPSNYRLLPTSIRQSLPHIGGEQRSRTAITKQIFSPDFIKQVAQKLELNKRPEIIREAELARDSYPEKDIDEVIEFIFIKNLKPHFRVENIGGDVFSITAKFKTSDFSYVVVKAITDVYINQAFDRRMQSVQRALDFNNEQLALFKVKLQAAEKNLERFKRNLMTSQIKNPNFSQTSLLHFQKAIIAIELASRERQDYLNYIESRLDIDDKEKNYPDTPSIQLNLSKIGEKIVQMSSLMKNFSWKSPEVISVSRKVNDLREEIKIEIENLYKVKYQDEETQKRALLLERAISFIDIEIQNTKTQVFNETIQTSENTSQHLLLKKLQKEVAVNRQVYNKFLQQSQGVQIEKAITEADASNQFKVLNPARVPKEPINAGLDMILLVTLLAAGGTGLGTVFLIELLDTSIRTVNEAEALLQLPVIGVLPFLGYQTRFLKKQLIILTIVGIIILFVGAYTAWYFKLHHIIEKM